MFKRNIEKYLLEWKNKPNRKPLIIRGARQVGKTSVVKEFAKCFDRFIYLNLEIAEDAGLFTEMLPIHTLIQLIELKENIKIVPGNTLVFIDEIQQSQIAMNQLRYFYENNPHVHVIAAGSLLEIKMKKEGFSFPVGRVEYCYMHPATFDEFIQASGQDQAQDVINQISLDSKIDHHTHSLLLKQFYEYVVVGGMPEAVAQYLTTHQLLDVDPIYESIVTGFRDDVFKYSTDAKAKYLQFIIENTYQYIGLPVKYDHFGGSSFRSREMGDAFDVLEKAMIISRVTASSSYAPPIGQNFNKVPKLLFLDMGLVNYKLGLRAALLQGQEINHLFSGQISEQIVGQTLISFCEHQAAALSYWYRHESAATSEIDYVLSVHDHLVPIEVKSGKTGRLKSLMQFMDKGSSPIAVRVYSGPLQIDSINTPSGHPFKLISLPFYLIHRIRELMEV